MSSRLASAYVRAPPFVSISTPRGRASSAGDPAATTLPPSRMTTRSQTSSISLSRCELSSTETPRRFSSSSSVRTVRLPTGSRALVGSSRSSSRGDPEIHAAERLDRAVTLDETADGERCGHAIERTLRLMPRGYEEGPVAEAAEARRDALERGESVEPEAHAPDRRAVYGSTEDNG